MKSTSDWQQALEDAQLDGQKNPLPLEVFKVSLRDLQEDQVEVNYGYFMIWRKNRNSSFYISRKFSYLVPIAGKKKCPWKPIKSQ